MASDLRYQARPLAVKFHPSNQVCPKWTDTSQRVYSRIEQSTASNQMHGTVNGPSISHSPPFHLHSCVTRSSYQHANIGRVGPQASIQVLTKIIGLEYNYCLSTWDLEHASRLATTFALIHLRTGVIYEACGRSDYLISSSSSSLRNTLHSVARRDSRHPLIVPMF
jgi:hypothetical protein